METAFESNIQNATPNLAHGASGRIGINVISNVSGNLGLGVAARNIISALLARGFDVAIFDADPGMGRKGHDTSFAALTVAHAKELPFSINLFVFGPPTLCYEVIFNPAYIELLTRPTCTNAAFTMWELPVMPAPWCRALEVFDLLGGTSTFVEATIDSGVAGPHVVHAMQPMSIPVNVSADRRRFNIPRDLFAVVSTFDPLSDMNRKNPIGALEAFRRAFPQQSDVRLVLKSNLPGRSTNRGRFEHTHLRPLLESVSGDPRIQVVAESLSYPEVLSLIASADTFISLHRAEGFGLGLLEAMALSKPVVATGWSGNKSFMSPSSACMTKHRLKPVVATDWAYRTTAKLCTAYWADPDIDDAALWLRRLKHEPRLGTTIGARARQAFERYQSEAAQFRFVDDIVAVHEHNLATVDVARRKAAFARRLEIAQKHMSPLKLGRRAWLAQTLQSWLQRGASRRTSP